MHPRTVANALRAVLGTLDAHDGRLDKATRTKLDKGVADALVVAEWRPDLPADFAGTIYAAVAAGRDPLDDPIVTRALLADRLMAARENVVNHSGQRLADLLRDHLDPIVAALARAYDKHVVGPVGEAHAALTAAGLTHKAEPGVILGAGPQVAATWATAMAADTAHAKIVGAYKHLLNAVGLPTTEAIFYWADPAGLSLLEVRGIRSPNPLAALAAGMTLGLATPAETRARQQRAAGLEQDKATRAADREKAAVRKVLGSA